MLSVRSPLATRVDWIIQTKSNAKDSKKDTIKTKLTPHGIGSKAEQHFFENKVVQKCT